MSKLEKIYGNCMAVALGLLVLWAVASSFVGMFFEENPSAYGHGFRGEVYRSSGY